MSHTRRQFLGTSVGVSLAATAGLTFPSGVRAAMKPTTGVLPDRPVARAARPLKLLILGGTGFIGPHQVRYAMYRGHEVTLFNRGRSNPGLFPGVETLIGDRDGDLDALLGGTWDAVLDNSGYVPRHVRDSARLLEDSVGRYLFVSTGSVYRFDQDEITEDGALLPIEDPESEDVNRYYGPLKILCEQAVQQTYGARGTVVRLHVVAGPGDPTNRTTYWPVRIDRGGDILAPGSRDNPVQFIDVRDLAEFMIHCIERDTGGVFNAAGPTLAEMSMAEFLYGVRSITSAPVAFHWVDAAFLREQEFRVPLWYGELPQTRGLSRVRSHKAVAAGLSFRPLAETARDTLEWFHSLPQETKDEFPLNLDQEAQVLAAWRARSG